jgi:hypothetical protein
VRALQDTELAALSGADFVAAVTGFAVTSSTAERLVSGYLAEDRRRHGAGEDAGRVPGGDEPTGPPGTTGTPGPRGR